MAGGHGLLFRFALFPFEAIQQGGELFNFPAEGQHAHLLMTKRLFQVCQHAQHIT